MSQFSNKVAVITGASQGIGAGLVRGFLDRGYRIVANSRSIRDLGQDRLVKTRRQRRRWVTGRLASR